MFYMIYIVSCLCLWAVNKAKVLGRELPLPCKGTNNLENMQPYL